MFTFKVTLNGQEVEAEADSRDIVSWERLGRVDKRATPRHFGELESALRMTDLAELAWCALERQGLMPDLPDRPKFLETAVVMPTKRDAEEESDLDPGQPDH